MIGTSVSAHSHAKTGSNRRQHERIVGPFDGCRVGAIETPLRIFDLSRGGCFVISMHGQTPGTRFAMQIVIPEIGPITLNAETVYSRDEFGFAVRFVDLDVVSANALDNALRHLRGEPVQAVERRPPAPAPTHSVLSLEESLSESNVSRFFRDPQPKTQFPKARRFERPRASRTGMLGSGYHVVIDGRHVALINLSLTGAQIRGPLRLERDQPVIVKIGWPQDRVSFTAIARVRWVQLEPEPRDNQPVYRTGVAFETWDVRRLKEIIQNCDRTSSPTAELIGTWSQTA
jgi:PilZ domain